MSGKEITRDFIEPKTAVKIARRTLAEFELQSEESLAGYLPSIEVPDVEYEIEQVANDNHIVAANWRSFGGAVTSETWGGGRKGRGELQPLGRNYVIDEYQRLKQRQNAKEMIGRSAADFVRRGTKAIAKEVNFQRGNALANARVDIQGSGGLRETIEFGRLPEFDTTAPVLWTDESADPLEYLATLCEIYEEQNEFKPAEILMSGKVKRAFFQHPKVVKLATADSGKPRASNSEVQTLLDDFDLPPIKLISPAKTLKDDWTDPNNPKVVQKYNLPQEHVLLTAGPGDPRQPEEALYGKTFWGQTVSSELPEFGLGSGGLDVPGIVAATYKEGWPFNLEVIVDAIAMPVVFSPNYTLKAKVI